MFPGCPASRAPGGSTLALLRCQGSAGSVGDSGLGFRRLWGFGWVSCGLGFLGSSLMLPRRQSQASSCYESHIVWLRAAWGGGSLGCWGPQVTARGSTLPVVPLAFVPCPSTLSPSSPFRTESGWVTQGVDIGKRHWGGGWQRKQIAEEESREWEDRREGGREREEGRGKLRRRRFPAPGSGPLQPEGAQFLEELIPQKPLLQGPTERREPEG